ncbi:TIGR01777 family oxidoreductase [Gracilibacillus dipsosauri]|uniref:TIGR01777 family oxidoreductase n=1 Tax=Gracilibacillus dipsosauri TaxID=178340 RepID=UPI00240A676C
MKIAIAGGTGFVGQHLTKHLIDRGDEVFILTRHPNKHRNKQKITYIGWLNENLNPIAQLPPLDAIINLAGESLFGYWTKSKKDRIYQSRIKATYAIIDMIKEMKYKPAVLINASAVGYFGTSLTETFTESRKESGNDFLAEVTEAWEKTALEANTYGVRTVIARFGVILGTEGALPLMTMPFKWYVGGKIGSGEQWVSWIHITDVIGMILFSLDHPTIDQAFHMTAPSPIKNSKMAEVIAQTLHKPNWLPVPRVAIKTLLGEMSILVESGQKVLPEKAIKSGYSFQYSHIEKALEDLLK